MASNGLGFENDAVSRGLLYRFSPEACPWAYFKSLKRRRHLLEVDLTASVIDDNIRWPIAGFCRTAEEGMVTLAMANALIRT